MTPPLIRPATAHDLPALATLYQQSVRKIAAGRYTPAQINAWASFPDNLALFTDFILSPQTLVACDPHDHAVQAFAGMDNLPASDRLGHIASLYTHPDHAGQGLATLLLEQLIQRARSRKLIALQTEASIFSRPIFLKAGFHHVATETTEHCGVQFNRDLMQLNLG